MTNQNRKAEIQQRMAETGEPYAEARRKVLAARPRGRSSTTPEKVYVRYTYTRDGELEFDAAEWANAFSNERQRMVQTAVGEELDVDFDLYGGQGIAECVDSGELVYTTITQAERSARYDSEVIEEATRFYAGIVEYDEWPDGLDRPMASDSYVIVHEDKEYVVLRRGRSIVAIIDIDGDGYILLTAWPKEIERR